MRQKISSKWFPNSKYAWSIFSDDLRETVKGTINILVDFLGEVVSDSRDEAEVQATTDLIQSLERYRDGFWYDESGLPEPNEEESAELV